MLYHVFYGDGWNCTDIERRIGAVTGQVPHAGEESINIHRIHRAQRPVADNVEACVRGHLTSPPGAEKGGSSAASCGLSIEGVHHDKVRAVGLHQMIATFCGQLRD